MAAKASRQIGSVLESTVTYLQRIGINVSQDDIKLPPGLVKALTFVYALYDRVNEVIPTFPDFDLRSQLMVLALAIPFVLDVVFVWFINPVGVTMTHLLDLIAFGVGTFFLVYSISTMFTVLNISIIVMCAVFIILRLIFTFLTREKGDVELYRLCKEICNYYMQGVVPSYKCDMTFKELNIAIHKFSQIIEIIPPKPNVWASFAFFGISFVCFFLSFWCLDAMPIPYDLPPIAKVLLPIITIPLGTVFFIIYIMRLFKCGRMVITSIKQVIRKWGLRIMLMILDMLYIPILTVLIGILTPKQIGCPEGEYLYYKLKDSDNVLYPFVNHTTTCRPCVAPEFRSEFCDRKCSGMTELRMTLSPDLLFVDDILVMSGGVIIYVAIVVMIGLPLLRAYLVHRNRKFVHMVNVYGDTEEIKWATLVHRMKSTGVFIFENYKSKYAMWGVVLLIFKFVLMVFGIISNQIWSGWVFAFPVLYAVTSTLHIWWKPYIYTFNTLFESILEICNGIFAVFTCITYSGVTVPEAVVTPITVITAVIPVITIPAAIFFEGNEGTNKALDDPTIIHKASTKDIEKIKQKGYKKIANADSDNDADENNDQKGDEADPESLQPVKILSKKDESDVSDAPKNYLESSDDDDEANDPMVHNEVQPEKPKRRRHHKHHADEIRIDKNGESHIVSNQVELNGGMLDSINEARQYILDHEGIAPEDLPARDCFTISRRAASRRMTKMYKTLDIVLDGSTIDKLTTILNNAVIFGMVAFGWYLGALFGNYSKAQNFTCG